MPIRAVLVKAFSQNKYLGSPVAVVLKGAGLTSQQMLEAAARFKQPTTAFIQPALKGDFRIRFFSPQSEIDWDDAGTIAAFHVLGHKKLLDFKQKPQIRLTQETQSLPVEVICHQDGLVEIVQNAPSYLKIEPEREFIAELLRVAEADLIDFPLQTVSTGKPKLIIPLGSIKVLANLKPDLEGITTYCGLNDARGFYTFARAGMQADFQAREFNPFLSKDEVAVSTQAAGALACYAFIHGVSMGRKFIIKQGHSLNQVNTIQANLEDLDTEVKVGGYAVTLSEIKG